MLSKCLCLLCVFVLLPVAANAEEFVFGFQEVKTPDHPAFNLLYSSCQLQRGRPGAVNPPAGVTAKSWYYRVTIAGREFYAVAEPSVRSLYIGGSGDSNLSDEQAIPGELASCRGPLGIERALLFGPATLDSGASVMAMLSESKRLEIFPAGFMTGNIRIEGRTLPAALVDANFDGRYDGVFSPGRAPDVIIVDTDGNGRISDWRTTDGETAPLGRLLHLDDKYYTITPAPDGSSISVEDAEIETGALETGFEGAFLALWSDCGFHYLDGGQGKWQLPAGVYVPRLVGFKGVNGAGRWSIAAEDTGNLEAFTLKAGGTQQLAFGPPLEVRLDPRRIGDTISTGIVVFGRAGERYPLFANLNGSTRFPPAIEVFVEDGKRTARGRFEYG